MSETNGLPIRNPLKHYLLCSVFFFICGPLTAFSQSVVSLYSFAELGLAELEARKDSIKEQLGDLARFSMRGGVGGIGFRSTPTAEYNSEFWLQIDFDEHVVDQVVLVPTIWRDSDLGFRADGFPVSFQVIVGNGPDDPGVVVGDFDEPVELLPRVAPLVIDCPEPRVATWVRLKVSKCSKRIWDGLYDVQLSEIFVFSGERNVALRGDVSLSEPEAYRNAEAVGKEFLVDGLVPYLMDSSEDTTSTAFVSPVGVGPEPELVIDLESPCPVDRIHLHATDLGDTVPQSIQSDFGIPKRMIVYGANKPDFSDAKELFEFQMKRIQDVGPIIMRNFEMVECRYVKLVATQPYYYKDSYREGAQIGFAEFEVYAGDENVSLGKTATSSFEIAFHRSHESLTDGLNFHGRLLPLKEWLFQLAMRHELEFEYPLLLAELDRRYATQTAILRWMTILVICLIFGLILVLLLSKLWRMREHERLKVRLAADLHDELGANIHAIGLLSDLAEQSKDSPDAQLDFLSRIRGLTERTSVAIRHCMNMQEAGELQVEFLSDMHRAAERIAVNLDHELNANGEEHIEKLKPRKRLDLLLFYKESLVNICRHSDATELRTDLVCDPRKITLTVQDNGRGLGEREMNQSPSSLQRRAKLLGGKLSVGNRDEGGTSIKLTLKKKWWKR